MLIAGILLGLVLGLLAGGSLGNLGSVRLRWVGFLFAAVVVRFTTETALGANLAIAQTLQLPLFTLAYGMLLIGLGDGGSGGDPENRASDPGNLLGKLLRIDVLGAPAGSPYAIPADNPYAGGGGRPEVYEIGLRNPFRNSVDAATGDIWIGDVGQGSWEEIDVARAGAGGLDFGWRRWEGRHCFNPATDCDPAGVTMPVTEYGHGEGCSVIGGVVYRGEAIAALRGAYLFSDYCSGTLWAIDAGLDAAQAPITLLETGSSISSIGLGDDGEVYLTDLAGGRVLKLVPVG